MLSQKWQLWKQSGLLAMALLLWVAPALAESANFGTLSLSRGFAASAGRAAGYTGGAFSLASIANRDRNDNLCLGYAGDRDVPDYVVVLQQDFPHLKFQVNSKGKQTTLLVKGPGGVRCGDTAIEDNNWSAGSYSVWVGAPESGQRQDYTLSIRE